MAVKKFGIDISRWQGNFNFDKAVKEGVEFVIVKGGGGDDGLYVDRKFNENYNAVKQHKLPIGVYWFSKALSVAEAKKEAEYFYTNCLKGKQFELPVYIDVENKAQLAVGQRKLTDIIKAWCEYLEAKGYWVGIYSSLSYFNTYMYDNELTCYAHWVAQWSKECTYKTTSCLGMWQFGGETNAIRTNKVAGVVCDQDYMLVDYPALVKKAGLNGFKKTTTAPKPTPKPTPKTYKKGDKIVLKDTPTFTTSTSAKAKKRNGTYYIYDGIKINGRYRITNKEKNCGRKPIGLYVSFWAKL